MRINLCILAAVAVGAWSGPARAGSADYGGLVRRALSGDAADSASAVASLRDLGPEGLGAVVDRCRGPIDAHRASPAARGATPGDPAWIRLAAVLDTVGGQKDNGAACLYWFTDLDRARARAARTGKPILSLRLLGRLDEDLSCANSRFMRTALYADPAISGLLRDRFVLHWESVRAVPLITIDFGDDRRIVRTITGNSLHYVLDEQGRPLDALPGLYGPQRFRQWLVEAGALHEQLKAAAEPARARLLAAHHNRALAGIVGRWSSDLAEAGGPPGGEVPGPEAIAGFPDALAAAPVAITKSAVELPVLLSMEPLAQRLDDATTGELWQRIAARHADEARLSAASLGVMAAKTTVTPAMIDRFQQAMAMDTVRNEYLYHRAIHGWFAGGEVGEPAGLTARIYGELFLTPLDDPWLGLLPADTYAALDEKAACRP